jgi:hypothetical protein
MPIYPCEGFEDTGSGRSAPFDEGALAHCPTGLRYPCRCARRYERAQVQLYRVALWRGLPSVCPGRSHWDGHKVWELNPPGSSAPVAQQRRLSARRSFSGVCFGNVSAVVPCPPGADSTVNLLRRMLATSADTIRRRTANAAR